MPATKKPKKATPDLRTATTRLVEAALETASEAAQRRAVGDVLAAFEKSAPAEFKTAISVLGGGLSKTQGRGTQVLYLTLGALVESGGSAEVAWPVVGRGLRERLKHAGEFARALLKRAPEDGDDEAFATVATDLARARPRDAAAWQELPSHCLAALACLTRSAKIRKAIRKDGAVVETTLALADAVDEAGLLALAIQLLEDEEVIAYHPASKRAFRFVVGEVATNAELAVLIAASLFADKTSGVPATDKLDPKALETLRGERPAGAKPKELPIPFDLAPFTALRSDGTLPPAHDAKGHHHHDHLASPEGAPGDFPLLGGKRFFVIERAAHEMALPAEPTLPALRPRVVAKGQVPAAALAKLLAAAKRKPKRAAKRR